MTEPRDVTVSLRSAEPEDAAALQAFWRQEVAPCDLITGDDATLTMSLPHLADQLAAIAATPNNLLLLAWAPERELIGYLRLAASSETAVAQVAELGLIVAADYRHQGLGRALMATALDWAEQEAPLHRIQLEVQQRNQAARRLYQTFGFQEEGHLVESYRAVSGQWLDTILMARIL